MFATRIIDSKEKERYNQFVAQHPKGHFLQLWEWGQVKKGMGWEPLPLVLEEDGQIRAAMLILKRKIPLPLINKCIFYSPRGPVVDINNRQLCRLLFDGARRVARDEGAIFLKFDPDVPKENGEWAEVLQSLGCRHNETGLDFEGVQPNFVFRLDIKPDESALLGNMHAKWRYNIRLAEKKGVAIREARNKNDLEVFYGILLDTASRDHFLIRG
ncbi:MAG: peptidoglycan bridge formation glycyltransferase FemA/FemB family protein, partial [Syntrophomonas sp.]